MSDNRWFLDRLTKSIGEKLVHEMKEAVYYGNPHDHIGVSIHLKNEGVVVIDDTDRKITVFFTKIGNEVTFTDFYIEDKQSQTPTYYGTGTTDPISYMKQHYTHEQLEGFLLGNIIKYATRANKKNGVEDYKKLAHYAQMLLEHAEGEKNGGTAGSV